MTQFLAKGLSPTKAGSRNFKVIKMSHSPVSLMVFIIVVVVAAAAVCLI